MVPDNHHPDLQGISAAMFQRFIRIWEFLTHSLWLSPILYALGGAAFAAGVFALPQGGDGNFLPDFWPGFAEISTVRSLLETLLGTLVTMTTFALSITMVVLTLAAGSLGPRMIRNFMGDTKTQNALGLFVGSILFLITTLMLMGDPDGGASVPQLSTTVGIALFVICVFILILFVHHLGRSIVADDVIMRVGTNLEETIKSVSKTLADPIDAAEKAEQTLPDPRDIARDKALRAPQSGYVQGIDYAKLSERAKEQGVCVTLTIHAGQHVIKGDVIGAIDGENPAKDANNPPRDQEQDAILETILIGDYRTAMLDIEFALRQSVEVALRALSPGINDPFTAIAAVYRLGRAMPDAMVFRYPVGVWRDDATPDGKQPRLVARLSDFDGMLAAAFNQIRQSASDKPDVLLPMAEVLESLVALAKTEKQRDAIRNNARLIARAAERDVADEQDRKAVTQATLRVLHHHSH